MTPRLSLLVEVPPYDDAVVAIAGLRSRTVELVVGTEDTRLSRWPGVVCVEPGPAFLDRAVAAASAPSVAVADAGALIDQSKLVPLLDAATGPGGTAIVYTDERVAGVEVRKPDWSPAFFGHFNYLGRLTVLPRELVLATGGFRAGEPAEAAHQLLLRLTGAGVPVRHLREIPYERQRNEMPSLLPFGCATGPMAGVSVLLPTAGTRSPGRGRGYLAIRALDSVRRAAAEMTVEVVVVVGPEADAGVVRELLAADDGMVRIVHDDRSFNFSRRVNLAAANSEGEVLVWMNDDVERHRDDRWLAELVGLALEPDVGVVGPKLLYPDSRVQTAGVRFRAGLPTHVGVGVPPESPGPLRGFVSPREQAAVTGAVLATRAVVFDEVGGMTVSLPVNFGDTDYCLKVRSRGYRVVLTPAATLCHHESASRTAVVVASDCATLLDRWPGVVDPYWPWPDEEDPRVTLAPDGRA